MNQRTSIPLNPNSDSSRPIKTGALAVFRAVRWLGDVAAEIPAVTTQAAHDVAEAWKESAK